MNAAARVAGSGVVAGRGDLSRRGRGREARGHGRREALDAWPTGRDGHQVEASIPAYPIEGSVDGLRCATMYSGRA
jgi:hypothetical protein